MKFAPTRLEAVLLKGSSVRLEPLSLARHRDNLVEAALEGDLYKTTITTIPGGEGMEAYIRQALAERDQGSALPFAIVDTSSDKAIGSTRYGNVELAHRRLEIGWTWLALRWQRTRVNTEAKLLLLTYAFETLNCRRVEFKTDALNAQSRAAIERLGAQHEGVFRRHMIMPNGRARDTVYYSIIDEEWASVKSALRAKLASGSHRATSEP